MLYIIVMMHTFSNVNHERTAGVQTCVGDLDGDDVITLRRSPATLRKISTQVCLYTATAPVLISKLNYNNIKYDIAINKL